jgi:hypothetical protein
VDDDASSLDRAVRRLEIVLRQERLARARRRGATAHGALVPRVPVSSGFAADAPAGLVDRDA